MTQKASKYESLAPCHLLIAEDREDNLMLIKAMVTKFGCTTATARNGNEAIQLSQQETFDAILMDLAMPVKNGLEAAKQIRNTSNSNQHTPIIAVTADVNPIVETASISFGVNDYITKPIDAQQLYQSIKKASAAKVSSARPK
jgi:CheY-like chemotaxis protein